MANIVSLPQRGAQIESTPTEDTSVVNKAEPVRAQLRIPLLALDELSLHLRLLEGQIEKCHKEIARARRNHRADEALVLCRHHLAEANRLMRGNRR